VLPVVVGADALPDPQIVGVVAPDVIPIDATVVLCVVPHTPLIAGFTGEIIAATGLVHPLITNKL
jgi:hypothetical protein